ncbi:MAG: hypothetical protein OXD33_00920 [Rhodobacteraceae bacterium]|nr:hypothetical protein [Paracoccaceae bacterium]
MPDTERLRSHSMARPSMRRGHASLAGVGLALALLLTPPNPPVARADTITPLTHETRRGADAAERQAVSDPDFLGTARGGVWSWGQMRIVIAEDALNCGWRGEVCPFVLLAPDGQIRVRGTARMRPWIAGATLRWIGADGTVQIAAPRE